MDSGAWRSQGGVARLCPAWSSHIGPRAIRGAEERVPSGMSSGGPGPRDAQSCQIQLADPALVRQATPYGRLGGPILWPEGPLG